jgi:hypothetical protein
LIVESNKDIGYYGSEFSIETQRLGIRPNQITYIGINDDIIFNDNPDIEYYTMNLIKKRGIDKVLNKVINKYEDNIIHVVINIRTFALDIMPSVYREDVKKEKIYLITKI